MQIHQTNDLSGLVITHTKHKVMRASSICVPWVLTLDSSCTKPTLNTKWVASKLRPMTTHTIDTCSNNHQKILPGCVWRKRPLPLLTQTALEMWRCIFYEDRSLRLFKPHPQHRVFRNVRSQLHTYASMCMYMYESTVHIMKSRQQAGQKQSLFLGFKIQSMPLLILFCTALDCETTSSHMLCCWLRWADRSSVTHSNTW